MGWVFIDDKYLNSFYTINFNFIDDKVEMNFIVYQSIKYCNNNKINYIIINDNEEKYNILIMKVNNII